MQSQGIQPSPIHGFNQWPRQDSEFNALLTDYIGSMNVLGAQIMSGIALGLGLKASFSTMHTAATLTGLCVSFTTPHYLRRTQIVVQVMPRLLIHPIQSRGMARQQLMHWRGRTCLARWASAAASTPIMGC